MPPFSAVAHHQHAVVHMAGACVVPVHSCGSTKTAGLHLQIYTDGLKWMGATTHRVCRIETWA